MLVARLPDVFAPDAIATALVEAIAAVGADLEGSITIVEPTRIRVFGAQRL